MVALGVPLPLGLLADGEWWEEKLLAGHALASEVVYDRFRRLDLSEQVLLAKPAKPELLAQLREGDPEKVMEVLKQVEPVKLSERSLRGAWFTSALLPGADLRYARLRSADLADAELPGADLGRANLQSARLVRAKLHGAHMMYAELPDADLEYADLGGAELTFAELPRAGLRFAGLQRADLRDADLRGAKLEGAELQGADLGAAKLQGADLSGSKLQGANLPGAELQGADLGGAKLQGADLRYAGLQGADLTKAELQGADLRSVKLYAGSLGQSVISLVDLRAVRETIADTKLSDDELKRAASADVAQPLLESCLIDAELSPGLRCHRQWLPAEVEAFRSELFPVLVELACQSPAIAGGLIRQINNADARSVRIGLAARFAALLEKQECGGLSSLPEADKNEIRDLAKRDEEEPRWQSGLASQPRRCRHRQPRNLRSHPQHLKSRVIRLCTTLLLTSRILHMR